MTQNECIAKNHDVGRQYIELAKDTKSLVDRYKKRQKDADNDTGWDFPRLISLYIELAERFDRIGNTLSNI